MNSTAEPLQHIPLGPSLTSEQAKEIYRQGEEAVVFALLTLARSTSGGVSAGSAVSPSTPSAMVAPYQKPPRSGRSKTPGAKAGHPGRRRPKPDRIDRRQTHRLKQCPACGGALKRTTQTRQRYTEDFPDDLTAQVTEHTIHRDWCPQCAKAVEPVVPDALPRATLGNRILVLSAWLHYGLGNTLSQIIEVFNHHLQIPLTGGGLIQMWYRLQAILYAWYEQIQAQALTSAALHADETGWRVNGKTHWLWCFSTVNLTYYMIDRSRGSPTLMKFFQDEFNGVLISDFWGAYNAVVCRKRQKCLVHLLRDLEQVESYKPTDRDWPAFAKKLRRLVRDAIRLWHREAIPAAEFASRRARLDRRLEELIEAPWQHREATRLVKRLRRHRDELFTFLDEPGVPYDNNHAERAIRPAVVIRKNSYNNRSQTGADAQAVLMSIYRTLKQRGHHPLKTLVHAIEIYLATGKLPPLPAPLTTNG